MLTAAQIQGECMTASTRILVASLLALTLAGCGGERAITACRTATQCLDDWRQHYDQPALDWLRANPAPSRRLAIKLLLSADHRDRDLGAWLVTLAELDDDPAIHRVVAPSLELGPEATRIHRTPRRFLPSLDWMMRRVDRAPSRDRAYADLTGKFGMRAVKAVEQRLRCRPACPRLDPMQAATILGSARSNAVASLPIASAEREGLVRNMNAPIIGIIDDDRASDSARLEAGVLLSNQLWGHDHYIASRSAATVLRRRLANGNVDERRDAAKVLVALVSPLSAADWRLVADEMRTRRISLEALPLHLTPDLPKDGPLHDLLMQRLSGTDTREAFMALSLLSDFGSQPVPEGDLEFLLLSPDPRLAAQSARELHRSGMPLDSIDHALASHWFPATPFMFGGLASSKERYRLVHNSTCRTKAQRLAPVVVEDATRRRALRRASRLLKAEVSYAIEHDGMLVASAFHGEFGGYLAVLRDGRPPEIIGHDPFGPVLHLEGNRFLVTSGVAHMGSLSGEVSELQVGPESSTLTHRLGGLSQPLAIEKRNGRVLLSTYAFGVMDLTDLSAPLWLGCQHAPDTPIRQ
jgi:hypothetical protein